MAQHVTSWDSYLQQFTYTSSPAHSTSSQSTNVEFIEKQRICTSDGKCFVLSECIVKPKRQKAGVEGSVLGSKRLKAVDEESGSGTKLPIPDDASESTNFMSLAQIHFVFQALDTDGSGSLSVEKVISGFRRIQQSDKINHDLACRMLRYAHTATGKKGVTDLTAFVKVCRRVKLLE
jgi:hypothetical protein